MSQHTADTLNARVLSHELMLALLVAMQALDLFWMSGDGVSAVLVYGFGIIAAVIWMRFLAVVVGPRLRDLVPGEVT